MYYINLIIRCETPFSRFIDHPPHTTDLPLSLFLREVIFSLSHSPIICIMGVEPQLSPAEQKGTLSIICFHLFLAPEVSSALDCRPRGAFNLTREYLFPLISRCVLTEHPPPSARGLMLGCRQIPVFALRLIPEPQRTAIL